MLPEMKELAELVEPHVWWSDGDWETTPEYFGSQEFLGQSHCMFSRFLNLRIFSRNFLCFVFLQGRSFLLRSKDADIP